MCACVCNECALGMAVTNLRPVCKIITCVSAFTKMVISWDSKSCMLLVGTLWFAGYVKDAIVSACYRTSDRQDYLACWTRTRHDFSLPCHSVQRACMQGSQCRDERLAFVASRLQGTSCSSSFVSDMGTTVYDNVHSHL